MKFEYVVTLKKGYCPIMNELYNEPDEINEVSIVVESRNRANADRMMRMMLRDNPNVVEYSGICIED